jgi:glycolate dehydrogenase FAD-binding subunit
MNAQNDISEQLQNSVEQAIESSEALNIKAGGSKDFYGRTGRGNNLDISEHQGIISYEPTELVITARAGTPLRDIENILTESNQMLPFEPPTFNGNATLGGTISCNFSGPRRAYSGAVRDFVLGTKIINGKAESLSFGGEVMKNVAGYDVSRLMTGAMGTLGVILEASVKVIPLPEADITLTQNMSIEEALTKLHQWAGLPLPVSASCFYKDTLYIRLSGAEKAIQAAQKKIGGEVLNNADTFWQSIKNQTHDFFTTDQSLWRMSLASDTQPLSLDGEVLYEWGGALRWLKSDASAKTIYQTGNSINSSTSLFRSLGEQEKVFQPLPEHLLKLHKNLKNAFDPHNIFNIGRMYQEF